MSSSADPIFSVLNPLAHPVCLMEPKYVPFSAWVEHIPFAMFLVDVLKPRTIVELGTHYGASYCAFCQAVGALHLDTRCYAVDTWQGDPHSGRFGNEVLEYLRAHHDPLYSSFSRLIHSTFDEAVSHFADQSIDLLHIDGYHTYEAVKHDFETWLPKVSSRGVMLFHDINARQADFGVWRFWEEVRARYPSFEVLHCHGLGVLAVGKVMSEELRALLSAKEQEATVIRRFFFALGHSINLRYQQVPETNLKLDRAENFTRQQHSELARLRDELTLAHELICQCGREFSELVVRVARESGGPQPIAGNYDPLEKTVAQATSVLGHYARVLQQFNDALANCEAAFQRNKVEAQDKCVAA